MKDLTSRRLPAREDSKEEFSSLYSSNLPSASSVLCDGGDGDGNRDGDDDGDGNGDGDRRWQW